MANTYSQNSYHLTENRHWSWHVWRHWIVANAIGETIGLGAAAFVGIWFGSNMQANQTTFSIIFVGIAMVVAGAFEGFVVGIFQSFVLDNAIEKFSKRAWVYASVLGAFIAWALGGAPSVYMSLQEQAKTVPPPEISDAAMYGMATMMGLALGFTLGVPQWIVLRRYLERTWWWMPANSLAWAIGMPLVFVAAGNEPPSNPIILIGWVLFVIATIGALVGAVHGFFLVWLLDQHKPQTNPRKI